jgi:hypothetical protein
VIRIWSDSGHVYLVADLGAYLSLFAQVLDVMEPHKPRAKTMTSKQRRRSR